MAKVIASSVIRAANHGDVHGHIFVADLATGEFDSVFSLDNQDINWGGRGGERGMRGIRIFEDSVISATHEKIVIFDKGFNILGTYTCPWLGGIHEICVDRLKRILYISSTHFNSIVSMEIDTGKFLEAHYFSKDLKKVSVHNPNTKPGWLKRAKIEKGWGYSHINNVHVDYDGYVRVSAYYGKKLVNLSNPSRNPIRIPLGTHNPRIIDDNGAPVVLYNHTEKDRIVVASPQGEVIMYSKTPVLPEDEIRNMPRDERIARHPWCRGLAVNGDYIVGGSTPGMLNVYERNTLRFVKSIKMSEDIRNAIHGLEFWPFSG